MTNNKQQTAVSFFLMGLIDLEIGKYIPTDKLVELHHLFDKAKEIEKEQKIKNITDYNIRVTEFLLNQLFNLEHSKHRIACEKLSDIRNQFIYDNIVNYKQTYGGGEQ
jgi:hypothetical protein